ncbi:MAG: sigma factor, partial [Hyphomicrobiales bacterium]
MTKTNLSDEVRSPASKVSPSGEASNSASSANRAKVFSQLARRVAETQDKAAFEEIFDYFAPRLKAYLLRLGAQSGQAEELVQEVMITLW